MATGNNHSIREFIIKAFSVIDIELDFIGIGVNEVISVKTNNGKYNLKEGQVVIRIDPMYFRPTEVDTLLGDYSKAKKLLGWSPKISFEELVEEMVLSDLSEK